MKLHLPKLLRVVLLVTFMIFVEEGVGVTLISANVVTPTTGGDIYLNVAAENTTKTWEDNLVLGDTLKTGKVGSVDSSLNYLSPDGNKANS